MVGFVRKFEQQIILVRVINFQRNITMKLNQRYYRFLFVSLGLILAIFFSLTSCTNNLDISNKTERNNGVNSSKLEQIVSSNELKVGYLVFPPAITKDSANNKLGGHYIETIKEIARLNNWQLKFIETDWANFSAGLNSGRFDLSIVPTFVTVPRALSVYFTRPLFFAGNSAIVRINDERFTTIESIDREGVKVAVTQGEAGDEYAKANFNKAEIISFSGSDQSLAFQAVVSGRADVALGDAYVTSQFTSRNAKQVKDLFANIPYNLTPVSWAVKRGEDELLNFIDSSLESLDFQGKLLEWEKQSGANWLHLKKVWQFTNN